MRAFLFALKFPPQYTLIYADRDSFAFLSDRAGNTRGSCDDACVGRLLRASTRSVIINAACRPIVRETYSRERPHSRAIAFSCLGRHAIRYAQVRILSV